VLRVRERVFEGLQATHGAAQFVRLLPTRAQQTEGVEGLHAVERVVISFVSADLRVQVFEMTCDPRGVARLVIIREQIARAVAQVTRKLPVVALHCVGRFI
jgi:hypothetical protein